MIIYEINIDENVLILLKADRDHIEVITAEDWYGNNIRNKVSIKAVEE